MSPPFRLQIPRRIYEEMIAQAVAELPNECCGILAGRLVGNGQQTVGNVDRRYPLINEAASPVQYLSEPKGLFEAVRDMRRLGLDVLAVYHSHPTSPPVPSKKDVERNYGEEVVNIIISLKEREPLVRGWWLFKDGSREAEWLFS